MANELSCGWRLEKLSLFYNYYAFIDTPHYLADNLFIKHEVTVHFMQEYHHPEMEYIVILCKCRKRDSERFCAALEELPNKMLICGHPDFIDFCKKAHEKAEEGIKEIRQKGACDHGAMDTAEQAEQKNSKRVS